MNEVRVTLGLTNVSGSSSGAGVGLITGAMLVRTWPWGAGMFHKR